MIALLLMQWRLPQASNFAPGVDKLFDFVLWISIISFAIIVLGALYFLIFYRRNKIPENMSLYITGHTKLESGVALLLTVIVMVIFWWGWVDYKEMKRAPSDSLEINVIAKQWLWQFQYADGRLLTNELVVPKGKPVKLIMTSEDVLHSFFAPTFRVKQDIIPNTYTSLWFTATVVGDQPIYCAEYCGTAHSGMLGIIRVLEPDDFEAWQMAPLASQTPPTPSGTILNGDAAPVIQNLAEQGKVFYVTKGCSACHSVDGGTLVGPSFKNLFGRDVELADGKKMSADENYIRESIMEPQKKLVKGFPSVMPTFKGQLSDTDVNSIIAFIKSLSAKEGGH
ncbi:MAG: cytochrome c oxidase subunit II [Deltaproteobacteria bacterium]|nr:cytochrome c oxidase subunit II [Deltaproteobacteria bacterium]